MTKNRVLKLQGFRVFSKKFTISNPIFCLKNFAGLLRGNYIINKSLHKRKNDKKLKNRLKQI